MTMMTFSSITMILTFLLLLALYISFISLSLIGSIFVIAEIFSLLFCSAPFLPSFKKTVDKMLEFAEIRPGDRVYDLGCGDGRLVFAASQQGAKATGIEVNIVFYYWALFCRRRLKKRGQIRLGNLFSQDLRDADVIFCYLMPRGMPRLKEKLESEAKKKCRIICHMFPIPGWKTERLFQSGNGNLGTVYKYVIN